MRITASQSLKALGLLLAASIVPLVAQQAAPPAAPPGPPFLLSTSAFTDGSEIPVKYTCFSKSDPVSPALRWSNTPAGTVTFALLVHDLDVAPNKGMFDVTHWIIWNIPGTAISLPEGVAAGAQTPDGAIQGKNVRGANAFRGPCPPAGKLHHYIFELYALDTKLDAGPDASRADVMKAMDGHVIGKTSYTGIVHPMS
jgi:Raf kinase inhibitor-like YbhB/YbcL family protein